MPPNTPEPITTTIGDFCRLSGLGRSTVYGLLAEQKIQSVKVKRRRLILLDSYRRFIEQEPGTPTPTAIRRMKLQGKTTPPDQQSAKRGDRAKDDDSANGEQPSGRPDGPVS